MGLLIPRASKLRQQVTPAALTVGKKIKGRKRHIVVDTMGNLLAVSVHAANVHDTKSGINPAKKAFFKYPSIKNRANASNLVKRCYNLIDEFHAQNSQCSICNGLFLLVRLPWHQEILWR